jgi:tetratricopeptide (TPR) repeat protein
MLRYQVRTGEVYYYLGALDEKAGDLAAALANYQKAGTGYEYLPSQARIADIIRRQQGLDEARAWLRVARQRAPEAASQLYLLEAQILADHARPENTMQFLDEIIGQQPDNVDFLYFRAMQGEKRDDLALMERDLRRILALEPENADALNALGYTLTDRTDRHQEALALITRALEIKPDEAAFVDSIGWVHYRLANYDKAIEFLRRALDMLPNDEVAAHLGEVLWVTGERKGASAVWRKALELAPDSQILKKVMTKFQSGT